MMKLLRLLLLPALFAALAMPAQAAKLSLAEISRYINGLTTAEADFQQINADGSTSNGKIYISRPGRMRFEYAAPDPTLVLAATGQVAIFDSKSNQPPEQYPLSKTPLNLILANKVDLSRARMVIGHSEAKGMTLVKAQDPEHPELGTIELAFSAAPVMLTEWTVTDQTGGRTTVILGPLKTGGDYGQSLFSINAEMDRRNPKK